MATGADTRFARCLLDSPSRSQMGEPSKRSKRAARHFPPIQVKVATGWGAVRYCHHTLRTRTCSKFLIAAWIAVLPRPNTGSADQPFFGSLATEDLLPYAGSGPSSLALKAVAAYALGHRGHHL